VQSTEERIQTKANLVKRIFAGLVDYLIIFAFQFAYVFAYGAPNEEGGYSVSGFPALVPVLFWCLMTVGVEQIFGATVGNMLVDLKPVSFPGYQQRLTFGQSLKRHLLDPLDMLFFGFIGIITIKNTAMNQRLGDIWAQTVVVDTSGK
jgi:uncharacterized RDD family membrane protein YckC